MEEADVTLDQIACEEGTDRASNGLHDYMRTYDELFSPMRDQPVTLLEIGVLGGAGVRTWARYFTNPDAEIYGLDPHPEFCEKPIQDPRVHLVQGSQTDRTKLLTLPTWFNICLDDGCHFSSAQLVTFEILWPRIAPGGFYCVEDTHSYAAPELCDSKENIMQFLTRIATELQGRGATAVGRVEPTDRWADVDWLMFRKGLAVLRKRSLSP